MGIRERVGCGLVGAAVGSATDDALRPLPARYRAARTRARTHMEGVALRAMDRLPSSLRLPDKPCSTSRSDRRIRDSARAGIFCTNGTTTREEALPTMRGISIWLSHRPAGTSRRPCLRRLLAIGTVPEEVRYGSRHNRRQAGPSPAPTSRTVVYGVERRIQFEGSDPEF